MIAVFNELASERRESARQIEQNPLVVAFFLQQLQGVGEIAQRAKASIHRLFFAGGQLAERQNI
ncbi:hypothetical protein D3C86_2025080 [compost metagenome]